MFRGKFLWLLIGIVATFIIIGAVIISFTYQRSSVLGDLRTKTDLTVRSMSKLSNSTFALLFDAEDIKTAQDDWYNVFIDASELLDDLSMHPGLRYIDPAITDQIKQTLQLWNLSTNLFVDGNRLLGQFLEFDVGLPVKNNINDILIELQKIDTKIKSERSPQDKSATIITEPYYLLIQSFTAIDSGNDHLWFFTTSAIEKLGSIINTETERVIQLVLIIAIVVTVLLFIIILTTFIISQRILQTTNIRLEREVAERTQSIQNLLDYSEEGFLSFGDDFIINPEISKECESIFDRSVVGENFAEILFSNEQSRNDFTDAFTLIFSGISLPDVVFEVIDSKVKIGNKIVKLDFHMVNDSTVMCQLIDITQNELLQKELEDENAQREMVLRAVTSKRDFISLDAEAKNLFATLEGCVSEGNYCAEEEENDSIVRALHTFKANAAFLKMPKTVELSHTLEASLIEYGILSDSEPLGPRISGLRNAYQTEVEHITNMLGQDWLKGADSVEVQLDKLEDARQYAHSVYPEDNKLYFKISRLASLQMSNLFTRLTDLTEQLARANGKRIIVKTEIEDILVNPSLFRRLSDAANHILRNMVTHGIEFPRHREKAGKPQEGTITIQATQKDGMIELKLSDDGAGLSVQKIKEHALKTGRISADNNSLNKQDYIKMIFQPGFSTADTITAVSGRGYGLSAVRESIYEIGGKIKVSSSKGRGTRFTIVVPNRER